MDLMWYDMLVLITGRGSQNRISAIPLYTKLANRTTLGNVSASTAILNEIDDLENTSAMIVAPAKPQPTHSENSFCVDSTISLLDGRDLEAEVQRRWMNAHRYSVTSDSLGRLRVMPLARAFVTCASHI